MRGLIMDFPADRSVRDIGDQFMFGPALLISPVHEYGARSRNVYLPAGARWYDFHSGELREGGSRISAAAPLERMPIFVRAGAIIPIGPAIQYIDEKPDAPILLQVYTGADGAFTLYEDAGTDYGYEKGAYSRIELSYAQGSGALSIGARAGEYPGMPRERIFHVRWITPGVAGSRELDAQPDQRVEYSGASLVVRRQASQ
jgi:alpha-D-xyloside xylohydrolase